MKLAFLSAGAPFHGRNLKNQIQRMADAAGWGWECDFLEWQQDGYNGYDFAPYQWLWNMGNFELVFNWLEQALPEGTRAIAQWIGTDILQHREIVGSGRPDPFYAAAIHIADATNLQAEARELTGLDVGYVRSIPQRSLDPAPIRKWDEVLAYVPQGREDFFRWPMLLDVARDYPDITFNIVARTEGFKGLDNVKALGFVEGPERDALYERCFAYLRPIEHDGVGLTLIEFAQLGRHVFHSDMRIPHVLPARSAGELEFHLDSSMWRWRRGCWQITAE